MGRCSDFGAVDKFIFDVLHIKLLFQARHKRPMSYVRRRVAMLVFYSLFFSCKELLTELSCVKLCWKRFTGSFICCTPLMIKAWHVDRCWKCLTRSFYVCTVSNEAWRGVGGDSLFSRIFCF